MEEKHNDAHFRSGMPLVTAKVTIPLYPVHPNDNLKSTVWILTSYDE